MWEGEDAVVVAVVSVAEVCKQAAASERTAFLALSPNKVQGVARESVRALTREMIVRSHFRYALVVAPKGCTC